MERDFFVDGKKISKIITRLNQIKDAHNWLSMQPNSLRYSVRWSDWFGEINEDNTDLHKRGIRISDGDIEIGYFRNGWPSTGNYINIHHDGTFYVGEIYMKEGIRNRYTRYKTDGSEMKYDH